MQDFLNRPNKGDWPYLWLGATYMKVREGDVSSLLARRVSVAVTVAVGVNGNGRRKMLGLGAGFQLWQRLCMPF